MENGKWKIKENWRSEAFTCPAGGDGEKPDSALSPEAVQEMTGG